MSGAMTSTLDFKSPIGMKSSAVVFSGSATINRDTSSIVTLDKVSILSGRFLREVSDIKLGFVIFTDSRRDFPQCFNEDHRELIAKQLCFSLVCVRRTVVTVK